MKITAFALLLLSLQVYASDSMFFTVTSEKVTLYPSEVYNKMQAPIRLPEEIVKMFPGKRTMGIRGYTVNIFEVMPDGTEKEAPLYDLYNHHFIQYLGNKAGVEMLYNYSIGHDPLGPPESTNCSQIPMSSAQAVKSMMPKMVQTLGRARGFTTDGVLNDDYSLVAFGGNAGSEYRNNPHTMPKPYGTLVQNPEYFGVVLHLINTKHFVDPTTHTSKLLECPCTPQRVFNYENNTIDGHCPAIMFACNQDLLQQRDTSCHLKTYIGGYRCCSHGNFLSDTSKQDPKKFGPSTFVAKFTFEYFDADKETVKSVYPSQCCDVTSDTKIQTFANVEYDVPACDPAVPKHQCIHMETSVEPLDTYPGCPPAKAEEYVELVYAAAHMHKSGLGLDLIDDLTGDVLCHTEPIYGTSTEPGNENGYITGILPCVWGGEGQPAPRFKRSHPMRTVAYYNNTTPHTGVMSLWLMSVSEVTS